MNESVTITIDGQELTVPRASTILAAARRGGIDLPTLCHSELRPPRGSCRLCLVEVEGGKPLAACHHPVAAGGRYRTDSPELGQFRQQMVRFLLAGHPLCSACASRGHCRLQLLARRFGLEEEVRLPRRDSSPARPDLIHPLIHFEAALCIQCGQCAEVCAEVQGQSVLGMAGRGEQLALGVGEGESLEAAGCVACGACLVHCPTAALAEVGLPTTPVQRRITTTCVYCAVGCQLVVEVADNAILRMTPDPTGSANRGHSCLKGRFGHGFVQAPDRLTSPLMRTESGAFRQASWDEALDRVAQQFLAIRALEDPHAFAAISSARCTNEENFLLQKFTRVVMGSNAVDNCARVCHSPSAHALNSALGTAAGAYRFEDVEEAELILLFGANPTEAHPVLGARIRQAVLAGCRLIVVDPRRTELAALADLHLALRPGGNLALINALQWVLLEEDRLDHPFIAAHGENLAVLRETLTGCTPEWAEPLCGLPAEQIRRAARSYAGVDKALILWGLGITESCHGSLAAFGLINLAILTGNLGRPGAGVGPIRGQNNVQGACDMGALPNLFSDYRALSDPRAREEHLALWGKLPPPQSGYRIGEMWEAALAGRLKGLYVVAQDVAQSDPNSSEVMAALARLDFLVVQDLFLSETAKQAHVVLPGLSFLEKEGTFVNSDRRIQRVRQALTPPPGGMSDGDLIHAIAHRMGVDLGFANGAATPVDPARIMTEIAQLSPNWRGVSYPRLEEKGFLQWPCPTPDHPGTSILHEGGAILRGRARLTPTPWHPPAEAVDGEYPLLLTTGRLLFHYNVGTMTRRTPIVQLRQAQEESLRLHPRDGQRLQVQDGALVRVNSRQGEVTVRAQWSTEVPEGVVFMTFHYPETRTNLLTSKNSDAYTRCPEYKVTAVRVEPVE